MKSVKKLQRSIAYILCIVVSLAGCASTMVPSSSEISVRELGDREPATTRVISRLEEVGYSEEEAIARVSTMTAEEIDFLAQHPESIERTGIIVLLGLIGSSVSSSNQKKANKEAAEAVAREKEELNRQQREFDNKRHSAVVEDLQQQIDELGRGTTPDDATRIGELNKKMDAILATTPDEAGSVDDEAGSADDEAGSADDEAGSADE